MTTVRGVCPACGSDDTLFVGAGGYVTCSVSNCPDPGRASDLLLVERPRYDVPELDDRLVLTMPRPCPMTEFAAVCRLVGDLYPDLPMSVFRMTDDAVEVWVPADAVAVMPK